VVVDWACTAVGCRPVAPVRHHLAVLPTMAVAAVLALFARDSRGDRWRFYGGERLGAVTFLPPRVPNYAALAVVWSVALPALVWVPIA